MAQNPGGGSHGIERGLAILEILVQEPHGMRITDIAGRLGINKAIAFRVLGDLIRCGYVSQDSVTQHYFATFKIGAVGLQKLESGNLREWAQTTLNKLADETRELVRLAVANKQALHWIAKAQGANARLIVDPASGADVVLHATASGKAWLSTLEDDEVREVLSHRGLPAMTRHTATEISAVLQELQDVRDRGVAIVLEEMDEGINAIAAPILTTPKKGPAVGTVSIAGPASRLSPEVLGSFASPLQEASAELADQWAVYELQKPQVPS